MEGKKGLQQSYYWSWILLSASLPLSKFTTSLFIFSLTGTWLLLGNWKERLAIVKRHQSLFLLSISVFLLFFIGLWNTENWAYALKDLKVKTPLLALPLFLMTGPALSSKHIKYIFSFLTVGAICSALIGMVYYQYQLDEQPDLDYRKLSPFVSHIRLSLMLCVGLSFLFVSFVKSKMALKWLLIFPAFFILYYLNLIHSLSSFVILIALGIYLVLVYQPWKKIKLLGYAITFLVLVIFSYTAVKFYGVYQDVFQKVAVPVELETHTVNGNKYDHDTLNVATENGHFVGLYTCYPELYQQWNLRSNYHLDSLYNGYPIQLSLIRYLTSRGLRKDSIGVSSLSKMEIHAIEKGIANVYYVKDEGIKTRIHQALWEIKRWQEGASAESSSVTMRLFFWQNAKNIIKNNWLLGTGTGDIEDEIKKQYQVSQYAHLTQTRRTHNQYLTVAATLGIASFFLFVISIFYPILKYKGEFKAMNAFIVIILSLSMLWEDTLETQAGVCLTALLLYLPIISDQRKKSVEKQ